MTDTQQTSAGEQAEIAYSELVELAKNKPELFRTRLEPLLEAQADLVALNTFARSTKEFDFFWFNPDFLVTPRVAVYAFMRGFPNPYKNEINTFAQPPRNLREYVARRAARFIVSLHLSMLKIQAKQTLKERLKIKTYGKKSNPAATITAELILLAVYSFLFWGGSILSSLVIPAADPVSVKQAILVAVVYSSFVHVVYKASKAYGEIRDGRKWHAKRDAAINSKTPSTEE